MKLIVRTKLSGLPFEWKFTFQQTSNNVSMEGWQFKDHFKIAQEVTIEHTVLLFCRVTAPWYLD